MIRNYDDFTNALLKSGFSMCGGNDDGIYTIINWNWNEAPPYETKIAWHTGDKETDPWEWRMRVLKERNDIAYAKLFNKKSGFITKEWYSYFLAVRRTDMSFYEAYDDGLMSHAAKRVYEVVEKIGKIPADYIKKEAGFSKEEKSSFDKALVELQMGLFITVCGEEKLKAWPSNVFCTTEHFWGEEVFEKASRLPAKVAFDEIKQQILLLNPSALDKKIKKFIFG